MHIISIDVGLRNLGVVILEYDLNELNAIKKNTPSVLCSDINNALLQKIYKCGKIVYFDRVIITEKNCVSKSTEITDQILFGVTRAISNLPHLLEEDTYVLIEIQITKNRIAERIQNHIHSTILNMYMLKWPKMCESRVHLVWSWMKTCVNGAPKGLNGYARKKWAYEKASHIIHELDPETHVRMYRSFARDHADMSDAYLQTSAWLHSGGLNLLTCS